MPIVFQRSSSPSIPVTAGSLLMHLQPFTVTGSGFGQKLGTLFVRDQGTASVNTVDPVWTGHNPSAIATAQYNMQLQVGATFTPNTTPPGTPHPYVTNVYAGCHYQNSSTTGWDVDLFKHYSNTNLPYPYALRYIFHEYTDTAWQFDPPFVPPDGTHDNNFKHMAYNQGPDDYGTDFWYWSQHNVTSSSTTSFEVVTNAGIGMQNPDANGHNTFWPNSSNPPVGDLNTRYNVNERTSWGAWVWRMGEICASDQSTAGFANEWTNTTVAGLTLNNSQTVHYHGKTDNAVNTTRSFTFGGFARNYGTNATPAPTQFRYQSDHVLDFEPSQQHAPAVFVGDQPVFANCKVLEYCEVSGSRSGASVWSNTSVTAIFWKGRLQGNTTGYIFILTGTDDGTGLPVIVIPTPSSLPISVSP